MEDGPVVAGDDPLTFGSVKVAAPVGYNPIGTDGCGVVKIAPLSAVSGEDVGMAAGGLA